MIKVCGAPIGTVLNGISYFSSVTFNGNIVKHITVNSEIVGEGEFIQELKDLYDNGCVEVYNVYNTYPQILDVIRGGAFLEFSGNAAFVLDNIPEYTDSITTRFILTEGTTNAKTLWASRDVAHSNKNSFSTFVINKSIRSDFGDQTGPSNPYNFTLNLDTFYEYTQKAGKVILNGTEKDNLVDVAEFSPIQQLTLGASASNMAETSFSNYLTGAWYNTFSIMKNTGTYRCYIVPIEDNKMVDLVTGTVYTNRGTGAAPFVESN